MPKLASLDIASIDNAYYNPMSTQVETEEELMLVGAAARRLGISVETLRQWADSGKIASQRITGGSRLFLTTDIEARRKEREQSTRQRWAV